MQGVLKVLLAFSLTTVISLASSRRSKSCTGSVRMNKRCNIVHVQCDAGDVGAQKTTLLSLTTKAYCHKARLLLHQGSALFTRA